MKINNCFPIIVFIWLLPITLFSQKSTAWITYGESRFVHSPGIEGNYLFNKYIGVQIGVSVYFKDYIKTK